MFLRKMTVLFCALGLATVGYAADTTSTTSQTATKPVTTEVIPAKVNVNTATIKDLMRLKGLNRAKAKNIITYRQKHGSFKSLDDLKLVKGFKKMKSDQLKIIQDQLVI